MKNEVSFLVVLATVFGVSYANASECVGEDCDFKPIVIEQNIGPMDFVDFDEPLEPMDCSITMDNEYGMYEECTYDYNNCPFQTAEECDIWYKKPVHNTALLPRAPHLNSFRIDDILYAIYSNYEVSANDPAMSPLLERYKILMRASRACCSEGIMYKMREQGAKDSGIYQFLKDDANYFAVATRCMVMEDEEFKENYTNGVTGKMAIEVRNACLCKNRHWFETLLEPFNDVYDRAPMFEDQPFVYTYKDSMQRSVSVNINDEVHTAMGLINACPK